MVLRSDLNQVKWEESKISSMNPEESTLNFRTESVTYYLFRVFKGKSNLAALSGK